MIIFSFFVFCFLIFQFFSIFFFFYEYYFLWEYFSLAVNKCSFPVVMQWLKQCEGYEMMAAALCCISKSRHRNTINYQKQWDDEDEDAMVILLEYWQGWISEMIMIWWYRMNCTKRPYNKMHHNNNTPNKCQTEIKQTRDSTKRRTKETYVDKMGPKPAWVTKE